MEEKFFWGSATAAYQCEGGWNEGGRGETQWDWFSHYSEKNINSVTGDTASDFYHQYESDIKLLSESGQNSYRFSIAWTRIYPDNTGVINQEGVDFYNRVIDLCLKYHIEPNVTLQHYDLPMYLAEQGGWTNRSILEPFRVYAKTCFELFGDRVRYWVTHNEIRYYAHCCYLQGNYPPHHVLDFDSYAKAMYYGAVASALAVIEYRKLGLKGKIGIVHPCGAIESLHDTDDDKQAIHNGELYYIRSILDPAVNGMIPQELIAKVQKSGIDTSFMKMEDQAVIKQGTVDFIGLNIYSRNLVKPYTEGPSSVSFNNVGKSSNAKEETVIKDWFSTDDDDSKFKNEWGREVYPRCIYDGVKYVANMYPQVPIYVTENGVAGYESIENGKVHDLNRIQVMQQFLDWLVKAYDEGIDVRGYYMWSAEDVYSWVNGYKKRYGLVYVDFEHECRRIPKDSWYWYRDYIKEFYRKRPAAVPVWDRG